MWEYIYKVVICANGSIINVRNIQAPSSMKAISKATHFYENDVREFEISASRTSDSPVFVSKEKVTN